MVHVQTLLAMPGRKKEEKGRMYRVRPRLHQLATVEVTRCHLQVMPIVDHLDQSRWSVRNPWQFKKCRDGIRFESSVQMSRPRVKHQRLPGVEGAVRTYMCGY